MKNKLISYIYFFIGITTIVTSIVNFTGNRKSFGLVYLCLAIAWLALGIVYRKREGNS